MNSLSNYIISERINNEYILENNLQHIDSALNKVNVYIRNSQNNTIVEGFRPGHYDISFNINEKIALSNFIYQITEHYMHALMVENGLIDENLNEGLGDVLQNTKKFLAKRADQITDKMKLLKEKLTTLYNFLKDISKGAINSIKDLCNKFIGMMIKFGCSVSELIEKFKADKKAAQSELFSRIKKILGLGKLLNKLKNVFGSDNELNKEIKESEEDKKSEEDNNEYDYAAQAKAKYAKKSWGGLLGNVLMNVLINTIAHVLICIVIPAFATIIGGPIVGAFTEGICKLAWGSLAIWKLAENHYKLINSSEFKNKYTKLQKTFTWIVFGIMVIWAISKVWTGVEQLYDCYEKWANGLADTILPSVNVQHMTKLLNDIYKSFSGKDTPGYEQMQAALDKLNGYTENYSKVKGKEKVGSNKEDVQNEFEKTNYKSSTAAIKDLQNQGLSADQISNIKDDDQVTIFLNGYFDPKANKWSAEMINKLVEKTGMPKEELMKILSDSHSLNKHLNGICARAGSGFVINAPGNVAKAIQDISTANGVKPILLGFTRDSVEIVQRLIAGSGHIDSFNWFDAFGPIIYNKEWFGKNNKSHNYFLLRMGADNEQIYDICEAKYFKYDDAQKEFEKLNTSAFKASEKILRDNENSINALVVKNESINKSLFNNDIHINEEDDNDSNKQEESSESSNNSSDNTNATNVANKKLKILEKTKKDEIMLVFYGKPWKIPNKQKNENYNLFDYSCDEYVYEEESNKKDKDKLVPVVLFNSLNMCFIDLVPQTEGGELRKNPSWLKGLQGAYEVLPKDNGMSMEEISEFFSELIYNSFMRCYNINIIPPIIKTGKLKKHWEINPNGPDGERLDFGRFTNKECLDIVQSKGKPASKFLGAKLFRSFDGTKTIEQDPEKRKEGLKDTVKTIETDKNVQNVINEHPNLKKNLINKDGKVDIEELDKIFNAINRIEQSYDPQKPKGLFSRIKSLFKKLFGKENKEAAKKYKPEEIKDLAFALKSAKANKKHKNESFEGDFRYWNVFEMANFETAMKICMDEYEKPEEENINENVRYYNLALYLKRN